MQSFRKKFYPNYPEAYIWSLTSEAGQTKILIHMYENGCLQTVHDRVVTKRTLSKFIVKVGFASDKIRPWNGFHNWRDITSMIFKIKVCYFKCLIVKVLRILRTGVGICKPWSSLNTFQAQQSRVISSCT